MNVKPTDTFAPAQIATNIWATLQGLTVAERRGVIEPLKWLQSAEERTKVWVRCTLDGKLLELTVCNTWEHVFEHIQDMSGCYPGVTFQVSTTELKP